jgi:hypothetical protein
MDVEPTESGIFPTNWAEDFIAASEDRADESMEVDVGATATIDP